MEFTELAAIIASTDPRRALLRSQRRNSADTGLHGGGNRVTGFTIDDDFQHGIVVGAKLAFHHAA